MKIEMIQNEQRIASFWMIGMRATRSVKIATAVGEESTPSRGHRSPRTT
jgi:hypothetical protein